MKSEVHVLPESHSVTALDYSHADKILTVGDSQGELHLFSVANTLSELVAFDSRSDNDWSESESKAIASVRYFYSLPRAIMLLAANEKTINLWRIEPQFPQQYSIRRHFSGGHECCIHSVSARHACQQFLSADDLRVSLWDAEHAVGHCVADFSPLKIAQLREVLLCACFHPSDPSLLLFSSTSGIVRVADLRLRARAMPAAIELKLSKEGNKEAFLPVTGADFSTSSPWIFARDLFRVTIWDLRTTSQPLSIVPIFSPSFGDEERRFQVKSCGESFVTGGHNSVVVKGSLQGPVLHTEVGLGACALPTVTCDPVGAQVFAAASNRLVAKTLNQNFAAF